MHQHYEHALPAPRPSGIASIAGSLARSACRVALPCSLAHPCGVASRRDMRQLYELLSRGWGVGKEKPTARAPAYSAESALLLAARAVPSAPPLSTTAVAAVLKKRSHASLLSFCTSFSQLSRYGLATPSSHDGCCAGAPICRQPVLRTLCFTNRWNHHLSSVFTHLTNSPFGLNVYPLHWASALRGQGEFDEGPWELPLCTAHTSLSSRAVRAARS